jgi:(S)-ureidoglycine aminohydrolase
MQHLGQTRSARRADHFLLTPDTFVRAPLPGMHKATAVVHVTPAAGARFTQYTAELEAGGALGATREQRFVYVLQGEVQVNGRTLAPEGYAYFPSSCDSPVEASTAARAVVIEKPYVMLDGVQPPAMRLGEERAIESHPLDGDPDLTVRALLPADPAFDFAVNTMTYQPGAALRMVEMHVMEHGLMMLAGGGIYRLGDSWYAVEAGDFIWMAPWCPQWFGALGKTPAKYLIYKDWNR